MSRSNPLNIKVDSDSNYQLSCVANGQSHQRVTITQNGKTLATFSGSGDGTQMKQQDGSTTCSGATRQATQLALLFQHSNSGLNGPFQNSNINLDSTAGIVTTIGSEDSSSNNLNGTVLTLVVTSVAAVGAGH
ncbi:MAG TPA: fucose-binding lectin II [Bryobacteraceae bacterium]|nr:fucose-binding lectin II [Bryobacteraceae bacterium]